VSVDGSGLGVSQGDRLYFEDLPLEKKFVTSGRTITEADVVGFAGMFTAAQLTRSGTRGRVTERRVVLNQDDVAVIDSQWTLLVATRPSAGE